MNMTEQTYRTPEGFELYKPLMMPEARSFADVLTVERTWDHATMGHRNGRPLPDSPKLLDALTGEEYEDYMADYDAHRFVDRFCSVRNMPGPSLMVTPTPEAMEILAGDQFSFFDRISFQAIYHESNDRVLIVASANRIIASRWLAYVDPATVPAND